MLRVALFIDEANIFFSQKTLKWEVDFKKVYDYFEENFALYNAFFYATEPQESEEEKRKQYQEFSLMGFTLRLKKLKEIRDFSGKVVAKKANLDIEMAVDMFSTQSNYDIAVLFTGDSDFVSAVERLRGNGKQIFVFSTKGHSSLELVNSADKFIDLQKMKKSFAVIKPRKKK